MSETTTTDTTDASEGFSKIIAGLKEIISEYLLFSNRSNLRYNMFLVHMRSITIRRVEILLGITSALTLVLWPEDILLDKPPELVESFAIWRSWTIIGTILYCTTIRLSSKLQEWHNLAYTIILTQNMALAGYLFGSVKDLTYVWFAFMAFIIPMFAIIQSLDFFKRLASTLVISLPYVAIYVISTGTINYNYLYNFLPLLVIVIILNIIVGHTIFYFDFLNFIEERRMQRQQQEIERLARHDQLTSLLNRSEFSELAQKAFEQTKRYETELSLAMIDLDHFKEVNDTYGHHTGDDVLVWLGNLIEENVRNADISCRYGGEEFAVLMPQTGAEGAKRVAERLRGQLSSESFKSGEDESFSVTCSIGIATVNDGVQSMDDLLEKADSALYEAKDAGRNCTICKT